MSVATSSELFDWQVRYLDVYLYSVSMTTATDRRLCLCAVCVAVCDVTAAMLQQQGGDHVTAARQHRPVTSSTAACCSPASPSNNNASSGSSSIPDPQAYMIDPLHRGASSHGRSSAHHRGHHGGGAGAFNGGQPGGGGLDLGLGGTAAGRPSLTSPKTRHTNAAATVI